MTHKGPERVAKPIVFLLLGLPLVGMVTAGLMGELGANPVEKLTHETGEWALRLLIAALAIARRFANSRGSLGSQDCAECWACTHSFTSACTS